MIMRIQGSFLRETVLAFWLFNALAFVTLSMKTDGGPSPTAQALAGDRVDFWTLSETGCPCLFNRSDLGCACCNPDLGCGCHGSLRNRCTQCGLEMFCGKMCNMTIDVTQLTSKHGAIYSPPTPGPIFCTYYLVANRDTRIKLNLYRLQGIGEFNHRSKRCVGGFLQVIDGVRALRGNSSAVHVFCASDIRFEHPVTIFKDRAVAVIQYWTESSVKSRFMLEFEFEERTEDTPAQLLGDAVPNSECDRIYRQHNCSNSDEPCEFSSPGYPGLYPNFQHCRFFFRSTDPAMQIRIQFRVFHFPVKSTTKTNGSVFPSDCDTHYVNIFDGPYSARTDPALQTLCGQPKTEELVFFSTGPAMVLEFITGSLTPPYDYVGFQGTVLFGNLPPDRNTIGSKVDKSFCNWVFYSNSTPSAVFGTPMDWYPKNLLCYFKFIPASPLERAIITLTSYSLESDRCNTFLELHELGELNKGGKLIKKICGPITKYVSSDPKSLEEYSSAPGKTLLLTFSSKDGNQLLGKTSEWISGRFQFRNDRIMGTKVLNTVCDVSYEDNEGLEPRSGTFTVRAGDDHDQPFWHSTNTASECLYNFHSKKNRSVSVTINHGILVKPGEESRYWQCKTECDRSGCRCLLGSKKKQYAALNEVFHISIFNLAGVELSCLCGDLTDLLPVSVLSSGGVLMRYNKLALPSDDSNVQGFSASFKFRDRFHDCAQTTRSQVQGILYVALKRNLSSSEYVHVQCDWTIEVSSKKFLSIDVRLLDPSSKPVANKSSGPPCSAKNTVKLFTSSSQRAKDKGIELCQSNVVTVNTHKLFIRLTATGRQLKHRILWRETDPKTSVTSLSSSLDNRGNLTPVWIAIVSIFYSSLQIF